MQSRFSVRLASLALVAGVLLTATAPAGWSAVGRHQPRHRSHAKNIVATLSAAGNFKTLTKAIAEAGLTRKLQSSGPYTVFAPDDAAFGKLPKRELDDWMKSPKELKQILLFHVVPGIHSSADLKRSQTLKTLNGENLVVNYKEQVEVGGSIVKKADIKASNGCIHEIDEVLTPRSLK